jgi:hypothetical protein
MLDRRIRLRHNPSYIGVIWRDAAMARRGEDPKVEALRAERSLNPRPEAVRDERFGSPAFSTPATWSR